MENIPSRKIASLQFLRAFACLSVLYTHVLQLLNIKPFGDYFIAGAYGVDLFFILSGFLIYLTTKNNDSYKSFAIKRIFRIFPLYWFCVILFFLWEILNFSKEFTILNYIQNFLMLPWNGKLTTSSLVVGVAWSTVYEVYFYTAFTLLLIFKLNKKYIIGLLILLFSIFKIIYKINLLGSNENSTFLFLYSLIGFSHIVPFILGILVAMLFQNPIIIKFLLNIKYKKLLFIAFHLVYFFILVQKYNQLLSYSISILIFILWLIIDDIWKINYNNSVNKFFIKIGDISYSIYLLHTLVLSIIIDYFQLTNLALTTVLAYVSTIVLSLITYKYIEEPFINLSKKIIKSRGIKNQI